MFSTQQGTASRRRSLMAMLSSPLLFLFRPLAVGAEPQAQATAPGQTPPAASPTRVFGSDAGMILNTIKPDRAADFELVMGKVKEALQRSDKPERKQQCQGWRVFKAQEAGVNNSVLYVFWVNPAVKNVDYTVAGILNEAFPAEVQELYKKFSESFAGGQTMVNLQLVANMGAPSQNG